MYVRDGAGRGVIAVESSHLVTVWREGMTRCCASRAKSKHYNVYSFPRHMCNKTKAEFEDQTIGLYWLKISGDSAMI